MRLLRAFSDWLAAGLEQWAAEMHERTAALPEREYWRGYNDAWNDTRDEQEARPDYCCGKCPPIVGGGYDCTCKGNPRCKKEADR